MRRYDIWIILALLVGVTGVVIFTITTGSGRLTDFVSVASMICTLGGTTVATIISVHPQRYRDILRLILKATMPPAQRTRDVIPTLVSFAEKARREGLLALEDNIEELDNEFLKKGIQLVVDGTDPEMVKAIMKTELDAQVLRHDAGQKIFRDMASLAPAWGMIGTLIGLVIMLRNMQDPTSIGTGMAVALITTFYGAVLANGVFSPIANRLQEYSRLEGIMREIMVEGMLSIQSGDNPRIVEEKLLAFLSPEERRIARAEREGR